ncbi:hypothetical protein EDB85DRAFT_2140451 [Lactarius pseudohatsudake]|nr:hypothetical protein EDB85DRAFT_2140451 [Lactarius pseudohatsudake]
MTAQHHPPSLSGPHPGELDKTQPLRVLRHPDARLSFASFHPQTASNVPPYNPLEGSSNPKRIVVETHPGGFSHWRFVPRARLAEGVSDEGSWPRLVDVLGVLTICDQDQWDIHKLDPFYDCFVPEPPQPPTIRAKVASASSFPSSSASSRSSVFPEGSQKRRRLSSPPSSLEEETGHSPKKRRHAVHVVDSSDDESEAEATAGSRTTPRTHVPGRRVRGRRGGMHRAPGVRTARPNFDNVRSNALHDETMRSTTPPPTEPPRTTTTTPTSKRRKDEQGASPVKSSKRARTHSPDSIRPKAATRLKERARTRTEEFMRRMNAERDARRDARNQALMEDIIAEMPEEYAQPNGEQGQEQEQDDEDDDEQHRLTEALEELRVHEELIAESRRKIAELERDRPLWEAAARSRERHEREQEEERRARREQEEAARRARAERARREAEREQERARQAAAAEAEVAKRRAEAQRARWAQGPWTSQRALERYRALCESFDEAAKPGSLAFEDVPWPTLRRPFTFGPEDIDWAAVETFFHTTTAFSSKTRTGDFIRIDGAHAGLLTAVKDENARGMIEVAANTVAQALTPLWREARGQ